MDQYVILLGNMLGNIGPWKSSNQQNCQKVLPLWSSWPQNGVMGAHERSVAFLFEGSVYLGKMKMNQLLTALANDDDFW